MPTPIAPPTRAFALAAALPCAALLPGCTTYTLVAEPSAGFITAAQRYPLQDSALKLSAQRFEQSFGRFEIRGARADFGTRQRRREVNHSAETVTVHSGVIDWLIFDSPYPYDYSYTVHSTQYETASEQAFGFTLADVAESRTAELDCGLFALLHSEGPAGEAAGEPERLSTFLSCRMRGEGLAEPSIFSLELRPDGKFETEARGEFAGLEIQTITDFSRQSADGTSLQNEQLPPWEQRIAGFEVLADGQTLTALSTIRDPILWIATVHDERTFAAVAINTAIYVFNDLDRDWQ